MTHNKEGIGNETRDHIKVLNFNDAFRLNLNETITGKKGATSCCQNTTKILHGAFCHVKHDAECLRFV